MISVLKKYGWVMWFAVSTAIFFHMGAWNWQWWVVFLPLVILEVESANEFKRTND